MTSKFSPRYWWAWLKWEWTWRRWQRRKAKAREDFLKLSPEERRAQLPEWGDPSQPLDFSKVKPMNTVFNEDED